MPGPTNEAGLVAAITKRIKREYPSAWIFKVVGSPFQASGIPDLLVVVQGRLVGLEAKFRRPGESHEHAVSRATPGQVVQILRLRAAGAVADVVTSVEEALALIEKALRNGAPVAQDVRRDQGPEHGLLGGPSLDGDYSAWLPADLDRGAGGAGVEGGPRDGRPAAPDEEAPGSPLV